MRAERVFIYPWVIGITTLIASAIVLMAVAPKLAQFFAVGAIKPPLTTRISIVLGAFLSQNWEAIVLAIILPTLFLKTKKGRKLRDCLALKLPVVSVIVKKNNIIGTIGPLGPLAAAGVPMAEALTAAAKSVKNHYYREAIAGIIEKIKKGDKLSSALKNYSALYPLMVSQAIEVGEETEKIPLILGKLDGFFKEDVARDIKNLRKVSDPLLMIIIGGIIGFLAVSIVQPLISFIF